MSGTLSDMADREFSRVRQHHLANAGAAQVWATEAERLSRTPERAASALEIIAKDLDATHLRLLGLADRAEAVADRSLGCLPTNGEAAGGGTIGSAGHADKLRDVTANLNRALTRLDEALQRLEHFA